MASGPNEGAVKRLVEVLLGRARATSPVPPTVIAAQLGLRLVPWVPPFHVCLADMDGWTVYYDPNDARALPRALGFIAVSLAGEAENDEGLADAVADALLARAENF